MKLLTRSLSLVALLGVASVANAQTIFSQNFEAGLGANESTSGNFLINNTNAANNGTQMMGHARTYSDDEYSYYQLQLNLTGVTGATMTFDYSVELENHFDRFNVLATTGAFAPPADLLSPTGSSALQYTDEGDTHKPELGQIALADPSAGVAQFDLSAFDGQIVNLRFQFGSDFSVTDSGFVMDNLLVTGASAAVPEPGSVALLVGAGIGGLMLRRRKK